MHPHDPVRPASSSPSLLAAPWLTVDASCVPPELVRSYRETLFEVVAPAPCVLRVDVPNDVLARCHAERGVTASAFVTACNPHSIALDAAANTARHHALADELRRLGLSFCEGAGRHPSNDWPPEASWLVFGVTLLAACEIGRAWGQNAIVHTGPDAIPRLVLLR